MIFYTALDERGHTHWEKTQADARAINKKFEQVDVPTDKSGLHVWLNANQQELDSLRDGQVTAPSPHQALSSEPLVTAGVDLAPDSASAIDEDTKFNPKLLEEQVEAFGMAGEPALEKLESYQQLHGVGAAFSRGVHLLTIIAAGEHQLARIFLRNRKRK